MRALWLRWGAAVTLAIAALLLIEFASVVLGMKA